jgi:hypothetical protein
MSAFVVVKNPPADKEYRKVNRNRKKRMKRPRRMSEPFKCPECRKTWQYKAKNDTELTGVPQYLYNFPSYGCTEYICTICKNKQGE